MGTMPCKTSSMQKNSFSQLTAPSSTSVGVPIPTNHQHFCGKENQSSIVHSEFISLAWNNMAYITSARKLSRETNQAAKNYYQLTFIDDMNEDDEEVVGCESNDNQHNEENDSIPNSLSTMTMHGWVHERALKYLIVRMIFLLLQ